MADDAVERADDLSDHDRAILQQIFNPTLPVTDLDQRSTRENEDDASADCANDTGEKNSTKYTVKSH